MVWAKGLAGFSKSKVTTTADEEWAEFVVVAADFTGGLGECQFLCQKKNTVTATIPTGRSFTKNFIRLRLSLHWSRSQVVEKAGAGPKGPAPLRQTQLKGN
jgi:hypothetical protein